MSYPPFALLQNLDPKALTDHEALVFVRRFIDSIPERLDILCARVPGIDPANLFSNRSLELIEEWMPTVVSSRPETTEEIEEKTRQFAGKWSFLAAETRVLTDQSLYIGCDVGIFLGEHMKSMRPSLQWMRQKGIQRELTYNHPVLGKFKGDANYSPIITGRVLARKACKDLANKSLHLAQFLSGSLESVI
jgi:hypothetical protein